MIEWSVFVEHFASVYTSLLPQAEMFIHEQSFFFFFPFLDGHQWKFPFLL